MKISPEVRRDLQAESLVEAELDTSNRLLPPRWGDLALGGSTHQVADWFMALTRRDFRAAEEDLLLARKLGRGARPLSLMGLPERLLYRGVATLIDSSSHLPTDRSFQAYEEFQHAPMRVEHARYVFRTDITAYYQYVDHERLVDEVISQTGDDLAVSIAVDLLRQVSGRSYGLPQLSPPSDILAEIYIEPMRRSLLRAGFSAFRFADDFRISCRRYDEALAAWEVADSAARDLGLVLNEAKTSIVSLEKYTTNISAVRNQELKLFEDLHIEALDMDYLEDTGTPPVDRLIDEHDFDEDEVVTGADQAEEIPTSPAQLDAAIKVLARWEADGDDGQVQHPESARVRATLLQKSLRVLASSVDPSALASVTLMLIYEPSLTPTIARYMVRCREQHRQEVKRALDNACTSKALTAWQATWLAYVAGSLPRRRGGNDLPHVQWLRQQCHSTNPALVAEAVLALARRRLISVDEVSSVLNRLTPVQRPTGVVALAAMGEEVLARNMAPSELDRLRIDWAAENL